MNTIPLPKEQSASEHPNDLGLIRTVYPGAITFGAREGSPFRGAPSASVILAAIFAFPFIAYVALVMLPQSWAFGSYIFVICMVAFLALGILLGLGVLLYGCLVDFFIPDELSVVFDRHHGHVFWVSMQLPPGKGLSNLFQHGKVVVRHAPWNHVHAELRQKVNIGANMASRSHDVVFVARQSAEPDSRIVDEFGLAPSLTQTEATAPALWEHVRRYMEEGGSPLSPGNTAPAQTRPVPRHLLDSLALVSPWGKDYRRWWRTSPIGTLVHHLVIALNVLLVTWMPKLPWWVGLFVPSLILLWATCNWLSYKTALKVTWPPQILEALGTALTVEEIRAGRGGSLVDIRRSA